MSLPNMGDTKPEETITVTVPLLTDPLSAVDLLPVTIRARLQGWGIKTVGDLLTCSGNELLDIRSFGPVRLYVVIDTLAVYGLHLKEPIGPLPDRPHARPGPLTLARREPSADA